MFVMTNGSRSCGGCSSKGNGAAKVCFTTDRRVSRGGSVLVTRVSRRANRACVDRRTSGNDSCRARGV